MTEFIKFGEFAPAVEKRLAALEVRLSALDVLVSTLEASLGDMRDEFTEQMSDLFAQMEAAGNILDELTSDREAIEEAEDELPAEDAPDVFAAEIFWPDFLPPQKEVEDSLVYNRAEKEGE